MKKLLLIVLLITVLIFIFKRKNYKNFNVKLNSTEQVEEVGLNYNGKLYYITTINNKDEKNDFTIVDNYNEIKYNFQYAK